MPLVVDAYFRAILFFGEPPDNSPSFTASSSAYFHTRIGGCGLGGRDLIIVPSYLEDRMEYVVWLKNARTFQIRFYGELGFMSLEFVWESNSLDVTCFLRRDGQDWHPRLSIHIEDRNNYVKVTTYDESPTVHSHTFRENMTETFVLGNSTDKLLLLSLTPDTGFRSWGLSVAHHPE